MSMTISTLRRLGLSTFATLALIAPLTGCNDNNNSTDVSTPAIITTPTSTCFWKGPLTATNPATNYAFPDSGAYYWSGIVTVPTGARMFIRGQYPHARYMSYVTYNAADGTPVESLPDTSITANAGSTNPFIAGNLRTLPQRDYRIEVVPGTAPSGSRPANTIYAPVAANQTITVLYRVYVADQGQGELGGVALPDLEIQTADGKTLSGADACAAVNPSPNLFPRTSPDQTTYLTARDRAGTALGFPALNPAVWRSAYNLAWNFKCTFYGACGGTPARGVGYYANPDNAYTFANISRDLGQVVVLHGQIPTTPHTMNGDRYATSGQLRYWSMCSNENFTQKVTACLFDEQVSINADGKYTIVLARNGDRPVNATSACGNGFLAMSDAGDGLGHLNDTMLIMRNMLPAADFTTAIQNTKVPGDEAKVLGGFLPSISYMSKADFEARGCTP